MLFLQYQQQLINFYASQGYLFTQNAVIIDNECADEQIDDKCNYTENLSEDNNATQNIEKEDVKASQISINPKLANAMLVITTLTIFHQIAKNNGFGIFDWVGDKLSPKKSDNYCDGFY